MDVRVIRMVISPEFDGWCIGDYLKKMGLSARMIRLLKRTENGILHNNALGRTVDTIHKGDAVEINMPSDQKLPQSSPKLIHLAPVKYEDDDVIVFSKPVDMPVHTSAKHRDDTLENLFPSVCPNLTFRPVNRLDRDTSGLVVVAKNQHSANRLQQSIKKVYFAVAEGIFTEKSGTIDLPIAREQESIIKRVIREDGQRAVTHYTIIKEENNHSLARVVLETGRTHQIRVHFSHIGHPLAGDNLYGGSLEYLTKQGLLCGEITFTSPVSGKIINIVDDLRPDMASLFERKIAMEKIASFTVDHRKIDVGMYISRVDEDIVTYDIRMVKPNGGEYLYGPASHTVEHLFATFARNSSISNNVVYVGPMGCLTGFYLLTRNLPHSEAIKLVKDSMEFISNFEGEIPGYSEVECGNYLYHDLVGARKLVQPILKRLQNYDERLLNYSEHF